MDIHSSSRISTPPRPFTTAGIMLLGIMLLAAAIATGDARAQAAPTLHVYVNRIQIPVLLLDSAHRPLPPVPASRFVITIQDVAPFHPTAVRLQGEDPISLTILVDGSDPSNPLPQHVGDAAAKLAATLRPHDDVSVLGLDGCTLRRFLGREPIQPAHLQVALDNVAATRPYALQAKQLGPCTRPVGLWDAVLYAASKLREAGGRKILVVLSSGQPAPADELQRVHDLTNAFSVAVFGIRTTQPSAARVSMTGSRGIQSAQNVLDNATFGPSDAARIADAELQHQAELSGGTVLDTTADGLAKSLTSAINLIRGRYILEFPRPTKVTAGKRSIAVDIGNPRAYIRIAGITVPLAGEDEKIAAEGKLTPAQDPDAPAAAPPEAQPPAPPEAQPASPVK